MVFSHLSHLLGGSVLWHELSCLLEGLSLLKLNTVVAVNSVHSGTLVGGSKDVVSIESAVGSTVAWNWVSKVKTSLSWLHSMEDIGGCLEGLTSWLGLEGTINAALEESSSIGLHGFLLDNTVAVLQVHSIEFHNVLWWDWLSKSYKQTQQSNCESPHLVRNIDLLGSHTRERYILFEFKISLQ